LLLSYGR
jgi:hypothetical protein